MKSKIKNNALFMAVLVSLGGCNQGATVSAESAQSSNFRGESSFSNSDRESASKTNRQTSKQEVLLALIRANSDVYSILGEKYNVKRVEDALNPPWVLNQNKAQSLAASYVLPEKYDLWFSGWDSLIQRAKAGDVKAGDDVLYHEVAVVIVNDAVKSSNGWPGDEEHFIDVKMRDLHFANLFFDEISRRIPTRYQNPTEFKAAYVDALMALDTSLIHAMLDQAERERVEARKNGTIQDSSSGKGTAWVAGLNSYDGQAAGWTFRSGGHVIFGDGYINGNKKEFEVSSSLELAQTVDRASRSAQGMSADQSVKGGVTVK